MRTCMVCIHMFYFISVACSTLSRGLGLDTLLLKFLQLYSDPCSLVLVLGTNSVEEVRSFREFTPDLTWVCGNEVYQVHTVPSFVKVYQISAERVTAYRIPNMYNTCP